MGFTKLFSWKLRRQSDAREHLSRQQQPALANITAPVSRAVSLKAETGPAIAGVKLHFSFLSEPAPLLEKARALINCKSLRIPKPNTKVLQGSILLRPIWIVYPLQFYKTHMTVPCPCVVLIDLSSYFPHSSMCNVIQQTIFRKIYLFLKEEQRKRQIEKEKARRGLQVLHAVTLPEMPQGQALHKLCVSHQ